jgi:AraC-like DNA-binding protein
MEKQSQTDYWYSTDYWHSHEKPIWNTDPQDAWYKILSGDFNIAGVEMKYYRWFIPSPRARRSYFYLQFMSTSQFKQDHYTIRSGVNSYLLASTFSGKGELLYEGKTYTLEPGGLERLFEVNAEMSGKNEMLSSCLLINMLTEIMLTLPDYDSGEVPRKIKDIRDYIQENFAESIHLEALSERFFISKYYLCHEFKRYIGLSPNEYLITVRVNRAKGLLQSTELRVSEIGEITGFASLNHFFYTFKKHEEISPSEYRKQWKNSI